MYHRDISCRLSGYEACTKSAYLVPKSERTWFYQNFMSRYVRRVDVRDHLSQQCFFYGLGHSSSSPPPQTDSPSFPKRASPDSPTRSSGTKCLTTELDRRPCNSIIMLRYSHQEALSIELLFARFAMTVFGWTCFSGSWWIDRKVRVRIENDYVTRTCTSTEWEQFAESTRSRNQKRKAGSEKSQSEEGDDELEREERPRTQQDERS